MFITLLISAILGGLIGIERQYHNHNAGFRTFTLICLGSTLAILVSNNFGDPGRIAAQVVSGVGFLGAGIILHNKYQISGLTTAACIWVVSIIGLSVGAEMYAEAVEVTIFTILILTLFEKFKQ